MNGLNIKTFNWNGNTIKVLNPVPYGEHFQAWLNRDTNTMVLERESLPKVGERYYSNWIGHYTVLSTKTLINANGYVLVVGETVSDVGTKRVTLWSCDLI